VHRFADVFQAGIAHQSAGQKTGLAQDLKPIADTDNNAALVRTSAPTP
jgi:hypothetical protein